MIAVRRSVISQRVLKELHDCRIDRALAPGDQLAREVFGMLPIPKSARGTGRAERHRLRSRVARCGHWQTKFEATSVLPNPLHFATVG